MYTTHATHRPRRSQYISVSTLAAPTTTTLLSRASFLPPQLAHYTLPPLPLRLPPQLAHYTLPPLPLRLPPQLAHYTATAATTPATTARTLHTATAATTPATTNRTLYTATTTATTVTLPPGERYGISPQASPCLGGVGPSSTDAVRHNQRPLERQYCRLRRQ